MNMTRKMSLFLAAGAMMVLAAPAPHAATTDASANVTMAIPAAAETGAASDEVRPIDVATIRITRELPETHWLPPGEFLWNAQWAAEATGRSIVVVNLRARVLSVYKGGIEIGRSSILYGYGNHPTPTGTFPVLEKKRHHVSNIYNAPMPHMMRLTWDGVALHGSQRLADDAATHGCVGLPREFAALLFEHVAVGDRVVIWSGRASG
jgi:lipoprotein-anchoring transpeptidase ErfK/SrfK